MNAGDQKAAFLALSSNEKYLVWIQHLADFKKNIRLSDGQLNSINFVISQLSPSTFQENTAENIRFKSIEPDIHLRFRNLFGDALSKTILNSLQNISYLNLKKSVSSITPDVALPVDCGCSTKSDYCSCPDNVAPYHCPSCVAGGCNTSSAGCGTLWLYSCGGTCQGSIGGE